MKSCTVFFHNCITKILREENRTDFPFTKSPDCLWTKRIIGFFLPIGFIQEDYLRELLTTMGDRFTDEEVDELFREAPIDKKSNFNYVEFTRILKHGAKDKDD